MANSLGLVQLEVYRDGQGVPAVIGTDGCVWVDGRYGMDRARELIEDRARDYCARTGLTWRRGVYLVRRGRSVTV